MMRWNIFPLSCFDLINTKIEENLLTSVVCLLALLFIIMHMLRETSVENLSTTFLLVIDWGSQRGVIGLTPTHIWWTVTWIKSISLWFFDVFFVCWWIDCSRFPGCSSMVHLKVWNFEESLKISRLVRWFKSVFRFFPLCVERFNELINLTWHWTLTERTSIKRYTHKPSTTCEKRLTKKLRGVNRLWIEIISTLPNDPEWIKHNLTKPRTLKATKGSKGYFYFNLNDILSLQLILIIHRHQSRTTKYMKIDSHWCRPANWLDGLNYARNGMKFHSNTFKWTPSTWHKAKKLKQAEDWSSSPVEMTSPSKMIFKFLQFSLHKWVASNARASSLTHLFLDVNLKSS